MKAWVTLLTGPGYLVGVRALHASLTKVRSTYPLVVMVTEDVDAATRQALEDDGCLLRDVEPLSPPRGLQDDYAIARFAQNWSKLVVWSLVEHEQLVFLDADMLVVQNMDELFDLDLPADQMAACHACRCNTEHNPTYPASWNPDNCFYTYCTGADDTEHLDLVENHLNSGLMVVQPDEEVFAALSRTVGELDDLSRFPFAEQDFLDEHFDGRWRPLSYVYNALKTLPFQHPTVWKDSEVKNIHFIIEKPWNKARDPQDRYHAMDRLWWDVADEAGLDTSL